MNYGYLSIYRYKRERVLMNHDNLYCANPYVVMSGPNLKLVAFNAGIRWDAGIRTTSMPDALTQIETSRLTKLVQHIVFRRRTFVICFI